MLRCHGSLTRFMSPISTAVTQQPELWGGYGLLAGEGRKLYCGHYRTSPSLSLCERKQLSPLHIRITSEPSGRSFQFSMSRKSGCDSGQYLRSAALGNGENGATQILA